MKCPSSHEGVIGAAVFGDESGMRRHRFRGLADQRFQSQQLSFRFFFRHQVCEWIKASRPDLLANEDRQPVGLDEQLLVIERYPTAAAEELNAVRQRVGYRHVSAIRPKRLVLTFSGEIVKRDEVADVLVFVDLQTVVLLGIGGIERTIGKNRGQLGNATLDEMNTGGLEWFHETA